jgi:hypothetical protein
MDSGLDGFYLLKKFEYSIILNEVWLITVMFLNLSKVMVDKLAKEPILEDVLDPINIKFNC